MNDEKIVKLKEEFWRNLGKVDVVTVYSVKNAMINLTEDLYSRSYIVLDR